jgi:general nucleoside transport system ATP-binding protein
LMAAISGEDGRPVDNMLYLNQQDIGAFDAGKRRKLGMANVPEERLGRGAVPEMSLSENTLLTQKRDFVNKGLVNWKKVQTYAQSIIENYKVKCHGEFSEAKSLSGGNLQKFIMGREIGQDPIVLICAHPTWGVDVGAALSIHQSLLELRDKGAAILLVSEDIDELFLLADRIGSICDGYLSPIVKTDETDIEQIGLWMAGSFISESQEASL